MCGRSLPSVSAARRLRATPGGTCASAIKQAPSQEGGPGRNHRDIHRTDAPPAPVLAMPSEVVDWTGGRRLGCIVPAGACIVRTRIVRTQIDRTWIGRAWVRHTWV